MPFITDFFLTDKNWFDGLEERQPLREDRQTTNFLEYKSLTKTGISTIIHIVHSR